MTKMLELLKPPKEKLLEIGKYANTKHAIYAVKKTLNEKVDRAEM